MKRLNVVVIGFNKENTIESTRMLSVNLLNSDCPIERQSVGRAAKALLDEDDVTCVQIVIGKRHTGEFSDGDSAQAWADREIAWHIDLSE